MLPDNLGVCETYPSPFHFNLNRENIVAKIEGAGVKAIERLNLLKAELIKDTVSHINSQVQI